MNQKGEKKNITYSDSSELPKKKSINQTIEITKKIFFSSYISKTKVYFTF